MTLNNHLHITHRQFSVHQIGDFSLLLRILQFLIYSLWISPTHASVFVQQRVRRKYNYLKTQPELLQVRCMRRHFERMAIAVRTPYCPVVRAKGLVAAFGADDAFYDTPFQGVEPCVDDIAQDFGWAERVLLKAYAFAYRESETYIVYCARLLNLLA